MYLLILYWDYDEEYLYYFSNKKEALQRKKEHEKYGRNAKLYKEVDC